tara:strand:+ start:10770 stop:11696 length:927 start_codon:yes stop_codon:yes gene_type:complete
MNMIDRIIVYNYKVPYFIRELLFKVKIFLNNHIRAVSIKKNLTNKSSLLNILKNDGFVFLKNNSCPNDFEIKEMVNHLKKIDTINSHDLKASKISYLTNDLAQNELFIKYALDDEVLSLANDYFNAVPKIAFLKAWRVNAGADDFAEMSFHMDHHGHRFLKAFWYLNDVEEDCGHHEYIKNTHFQPRLDKQLSNAPNEVKKQINSKRNLKGKYIVNNQTLVDYFKNNLIKISGKAGSGFIEDTRGLHRGTEMPTNKYRIIYQVLYVPYVTDKDRNTHSSISNKNTFEMFVNKNVTKQNLYKYIFTDLI